MTLANRAHVRRLLENQATPCVSIYLPTKRGFPGNREGAVRYRNLLRQAENLLAEKYPASDHAALLKPLRALAADEKFWEHSLDGVAVFAAPGLCEILQLQRSPDELAAVEDRFRLKWLLRFVQSSDRFEVLGLTAERAMMFEGDRYVLDPVELPEGFPARIEDALGDEVTEPYVTAAGQRHGQGSRKDEVGKDTPRYFRAVDRAVIEHFSRRSTLPLVLIALAENQSEFRAVSKSPFLVDAPVLADPASLDVDQVRELAWKTLELGYLSKLEQFKSRFNEARAKGLGTDDLSDAARAAVAGRIDTLLLAQESKRLGTIDHTTGAIAPTDDEAAGDMLDELAELALASNADVVVTPRGNMPTAGGLAAVYRY